MKSCTFATLNFLFFSLCPHTVNVSPDQYNDEFFFIPRVCFVFHHLHEVVVVSLLRMLMFDSSLNQRQLMDNSI